MKLTTEQIEAVLTAEQVETLAAIGKSWGAEEAANFDYDTFRRITGKVVEWTRGQYCGSLDHLKPAGDPDSDEWQEKWEAIKDAAETVIDDAASAAWDAYHAQ